MTLRKAFNSSPLTSWAALSCIDLWQGFLHFYNTCLLCTYCLSHICLATETVSPQALFYRYQRIHWLSPTFISMTCVRDAVKQKCSLSLLSHNNNGFCQPFVLHWHKALGAKVWPWEAMFLWMPTQLLTLLSLIACVYNPLLSCDKGVALV